MHVACRCKKSFAYRCYTNHRLACKARLYDPEEYEDADDEDELIPVSKPKKNSKRKTRSTITTDSPKTRRYAMQLHY